MRTPKKGDRCEYRIPDSYSMSYLYPCPVKHLEGKSPGQLVQRLEGEGKARRSVLLCFEHDHAPAARRRQPKKSISAQQEVLL